MNILIVGKNSYIGNHIDKWLTDRGHRVEQLDLLTEDWKNYEYSFFDAIVYVAGIVHRPDCNDWDLYKRVNTDMPIEIAKIAKDSGVKSFVYFSSMAVYGLGKNLHPTVIDENTMLHSEGMYGKSKLMAEEGLQKLNDECFNVACVRPPSVYGKGCRGGYITGFASIVKLLPILPRAYTNVRQSFIYIDNLAECVRLIVEKNLSGAFCPQDDVIPNANELLEAIAKAMGKKYRESSLLGGLMKMVSFIPLVNKAFGGIEYSRELSDIKGENYIVVSFREGMKRTLVI